MPKFTIVTPSYNQGQFLERTICSVVEQEGFSLEYFIMDGGSTDESVNIIQRYSERLEGWRSGPDSGQPWAINRGLEQATGDYVAYINSDDYYSPDAFELVDRIFQEREDVDWICGVVNVVDAEGQALRKQIPQPRNDFLESLVWGVDIGQPGVFLRRSVVEKMGLFDESLNYTFDTEYWVRLIRAGYQPTITSRTLAYRCLHGDTKTEMLPFKFDVERNIVLKRYEKNFSSIERELLASHLREKAVHEQISSAAAAFRSRRFVRSLTELRQAFDRSPASTVRNIWTRLSHRIG